MQQQTGRVWLLIGKSGLGKTALLEKWTGRSLEHQRIPFYISLGSGSVTEEVSAIMEQYGDINIQNDAALDFLKGGGFIILLDGLNEDRTPDATKAFVRKLYKRNHIIVSSQVNPKWEQSLETASIVLKPFGREELGKIMAGKWVDEVLGADYLSDLAELPHTAQLLADYIQENNQLPPLRLDIYRTLSSNLRNDTQIWNLEATAWNLFKENRNIFSPDSTVPAPFCESAVESGILTKAGSDYKFRHELVHRFFVVCYLDRQDKKSLEEWYREVRTGLGRAHWADTLELWGEFYAERASRDERAEGMYYQFLDDAAKFSLQIFAERLFPQIQRLYKTRALEKNAQFIERAANSMAPIAARVQE